MSTKAVQLDFLRGTSIPSITSRVTGLLGANSAIIGWRWVSSWTGCQSGCRATHTHRPIMLVFLGRNHVHGENVNSNPPSISLMYRTVKANISHVKVWTRWSPFDILEKKPSLNSSGQICKILRSPIPRLIPRSQGRLSKFWASIGALRIRQDNAQYNSPTDSGFHSDGDKSLKCFICTYFGAWGTTFHKWCSTWRHLVCA